ncbi:hypothetical protein BC936DRAFT_147445 [Jimgerdemannia flammicorona]|uniref:Isochorismatase-like domain-containing protein n=1 Tax=Jimgerdemannia flammicorona TaxID=994334 RepID=A0A433D5A0_9FUNG|nr:hypothetical protein BC936DRAFT_147445 [Jimgerdemannia flammicorona]
MTRTKMEHFTPFWLERVPLNTSAMSVIARVRPANTAFFVCDIQERFRSLIWQFPSVISTSSKMVRLNMGSLEGEMDKVWIDVFSIVPRPLRFLVSRSLSRSRIPQADSIANIGRDSSLADSPALGATISELDVSDAKLVVPKTKFSMYVPEVATEMSRTKINSVVLFGIESHVCVLQTALELLENRIDVHVLADGVSSMNYPEIDIALNRMKQAGANVTTSESIIFQLVGDASNEKFKAISNLVKEYKEASQVNKLLFKPAV